MPFVYLDDEGPAGVAVCTFDDGRCLTDPTIQEVGRALGLVAAPSRESYDFAVIGAGPAGLAAAVYASSEGLSTVVVEEWAPGGQAGTSCRIENYLGFPEGISGAELAERARHQAEKFGAEILMLQSLVDGRAEDGQFVGHPGRRHAPAGPGGPGGHRRRLAPARGGRASTGCCTPASTTAPPPARRPA